MSYDPVGAGLGLLGGIITNDANADIASARTAFDREQAEIGRYFEEQEALKNRRFQSSEALLNRTFQAEQAIAQQEFAERMSSTAVQRRMDDLSKAGINPILAGKYDASSPTSSLPSGSMGSGAQARAHTATASGYTAENVIARMLEGAQSAIALSKGEQEIDKLKEEIKGVKLDNITRAKTAGVSSQVLDAVEGARGIWDNTFGKVFNNSAKGLEQFGRFLGGKLYDIFGDDAEITKSSVYPKFFFNGKQTGGSERIDWENKKPIFIDK